MKVLAGIDFGTDSVRTLLCDAATGSEISCGVAEYSRWKQKKYCIPNENQYRQHALDYIEGLTDSFCKALHGLPEESRAQVIAISVDTTGSTPCPVDRAGTPLCLIQGYEDHPGAMFHLWKDHTAVEDAKEINDVFSCGEIDYTKYQGIYSSEWFWAKILHTVRMSPEIRERAYTWIEHSDWIIGLLAGTTQAVDFARGSCAAGHKALWNSEFGGLPSRERLSSIDPYLGMVYDRYPAITFPAGTPVGNISKFWADKFNINDDARIIMGSFDAHAGGVGAGIEKYTMVKVAGTSTVDLVVEDREILKGKNLREICGQAEDSIIPGYIGMEMGQPAFGDAYLWVRNLSLWPLHHIDSLPGLERNHEKNMLITYLEKNLIKELEKQAEDHIFDSEIALDWFNGRRYPALNERVKSMIAHLSLGTDLPALFCSIVKGTVFGSRRIFDSLLENGVIIKKVIAVGGIAEKSSFVMQMLADVLNVPIYVCRDSQVCAKGAVIYASVGAGIFASISEAQKQFCNFDTAPYIPDKSRQAMYEMQYRQYLEMGELGESLSRISHKFGEALL